MPLDFSLLKPVTKAACSMNGRAKLGPDGQVLEIMWTSRPVFCKEALEAREGYEKDDKVLRLKTGENAARGAQRAKKRLFDLAVCNDFDLFITLTLSRKKIDRYNVEVIIKKLNTWLDNRTRRNGLKYVIVPERHKDGAIHFHGLINSSAVKMVDSGRVYKKDGRTIYNLPDWKFGYTTAVRLNGNYERVCYYISKYITKQQDGGMIAGRYFYSGGDLERPRYVLFDWDEKPEGKEIKIDEAKLSVVYVTDMSLYQPLPR